MTTITTLSSMVDNAITLPENGVINFKLLRAFLHSLIQHLQLGDATVKYESKLEETESDILFENRKEREGNLYSKTVMITEEREKQSDDFAIEQSDVTKSKSKISKNEDDKEFGERKSISSTAFSQAEISESIGRLEQKIIEIASKLEAAESMSGHGEMSSRASQQRASGSFSDSLKLINISKRVDACEENVQKLAPALEDLSKESLNSSMKFNELTRQLSKLVPGLEGIEEQLMVNQKSTENLKAGLEVKRISLSSMQQTGMDNKVIEAFTEMQQNLVAMKEEISELHSQQKYIASIAVSETVPVEAITELQNQISELKTKVQTFGGPMTEDSTNSESEKIVLLESQMNEYSSRINGLCDNFSEQMNQSQGHITDIEKDLALILEKINVNTKPEISDMTSLGELYEKIVNLQENMDILNETTSKLAEDQEGKQTDLNALLEQIELMKIMKADKEALEDALTDKADALTVNRKVSHDQFDAAFEELNRTIEEAQEKLGQQERGWLNALEEIQREISSKIDRIEITPLKEMIDNKMQNIQEKIKVMTAKRQEIEALGTKKKLLRNLNCISCDKKVVMRTTLNGSALPLKASLPPNRSMRPYLTYELDQIRQQNKRLPSRNMLHLSNAVAEQRQMSKEPKSDQKENHLCNRYCGGSHTIVTSQQRVSRVGHFPEGIIKTENGTKEVEGNNDISEKMNLPNPTPRSSRIEA